MKKSTQKKRLLHFCMFLIFIIIFLYTFNITTSRYIGQIAADDNIIAVPILTLSNNTMAYTISNMLPGDEKSYDFTVSNTENGNINEVLLDYYFSVQAGTELPLTFELYDITRCRNKININRGKNTYYKNGIWNSSNKKI